MSWAEEGDAPVEQSGWFCRSKDGEDLRSIVSFSFVLIGIHQHVIHVFVCNVRRMAMYSSTLIELHI